MNWRDTKRAAREIVHAQFSIPANLYRGAAPPVVVYVRLADMKATEHGNLPGTRDHYAVMEDQNPTIIARTADYDPDNLDVLCFALGECYRVNNVLPFDLITTKAECLRLEVADTAPYIPPV